MASTIYTVFEANAEGDFADSNISRSNKQSAINAAVELRNTAKAAVQVRTGAGTVVFEMKNPGSRVIKSRVPSFTRTEADLPENFTTPEGTTPAYVRKRAGLVVCRKDDRSGYVVVDTRTGKSHEVSSTVEARELTNELGLKAREAKALADA